MHSLYSLHRWNRQTSGYFFAADCVGLSSPTFKQQASEDETYCEDKLKEHRGCSKSSKLVHWSVIWYVILTYEFIWYFSPIYVTSTQISVVISFQVSWRQTGPHVCQIHRVYMCLWWLCGSLKNKRGLEMNTLSWIQYNIAAMSHIVTRKHSERLLLPTSSAPDPLNFGCLYQNW